MISHMNKNNLPNFKTNTKVYIPPTCQVILIETQRVICASGTEDVGEFDGVW